MGIVYKCFKLFFINLSMNIIELDKKYIAHTYQRFNIVIERGKGAYVWDEEGKRYIDCVAGVAVNNVGHCNSYVVREIKKQAEKLIHSSNWFYSKQQVIFAELLTKISSLDKVFFCNSGTEAVEAAIKLARKFTKKKEIIGMEGAFHGRTMGALSLTWNKKYREAYSPLLPYVKWVPWNNAEEVERKITEKTAGIIIEPIQIEGGGVRIPSKNYLKELREICDKKRILLIFDEVQTGFGRTGKMFAFEWWGVLPDILCVAKGIAGGFPMGAMIAKEEVMNSFEPGDHGSTFGGNPLACSAGIASVNFILKNKLAESSETIGKYFIEELKKIKSPMIKEIRGMGLLVGVELKEDARKYCELLLKKRVLTTPLRNVIRFVPPLVITHKQINCVVKAIKEIL